MGMSLRAYARHRGVSDTAVRKAAKSGRISLEPDGTVDAAKADAEWARNTNVAQKRAPEKTKPVPRAAMDAVTETLNEPRASSFGSLSSGSSGSDSGSSTYMQARTANEVLKAQASRLKLNQMKQELVDRAQALAHVFRLAREERDAWLTWPSRVSAELAADLNVDTHALHSALEKVVREHLTELAELKPRIDG